MTVRSRALPILLLLLLCASASVSAQRYRVGDTVQTFTLVNRATNEAVHLSDFEGKIVFLEWFAYWCPFCQAAAEQVRSGIVDHYSSRGGNVNGVPVLHVGINLEGGNDALSQQFIDRYEMELVLNDFDAALANKFQPGGQPVFAIVNGVAGSPSHRKWELLYSRLGFGDTTHPIAEFRSAIDSVQAAPEVEAPALVASPQSARMGTGSALALSVQASGDDLSYHWQKDGIPIEGQAAAQLQIPSLTLADGGAYTVRVSNSAGQVVSGPAHVEVVRSLNDFLVAAGLHGADLRPEADPDRDGFANALEYLAQSDPNAFFDTPEARLEFTTAAAAPALRIRFSSSSDTIGYSLSAHFWAYPPEAGSATHSLPLGQAATLTQAIPSAAKTYLARLQATPTYDGSEAPPAVGED